MFPSPSPIINFDSNISCEVRTTEAASNSRLVAYPRTISTGIMDEREFSLTPPPAMPVKKHPTSQEILDMRFRGIRVIPGIAKRMRVLYAQTRERKRSRLAQYGRFISSERVQVRAWKAQAMRDIPAHCAFMRKQRNLRRLMIFEINLLTRRGNAIKRLLRAANLLYEFRNELDAILTPEVCPLPEVNVFSSGESFEWELRQWACDTGIRFDLDPHSSDEKLTRRERWKKRQTATRIEKEKVLHVPHPPPNPLHMAFGGLKRHLVQNAEFKARATPLKRPKHMDPHSAFVESFDCVRVRKTLELMSASTGNIIDETVISRLEGLALLVTNLYQCTTMTHALTTILAYVKSCYQGSVVVVVSKYISSLLEDDLECHAGISGDWLTLFRSGMSNWKLFSTHIAFKKLSYLCSCLVTLGLCEQSKLTWSVKGINVFAPAILERHVNAVDLIGAVVETLMFFVESGFECFRTGSLTPLLFSDQHAREFDNNYCRILEYSNYFDAGNLQHQTDLDENSYSLLLDQTIDAAKMLRDATTSQWEKNIFTPRLVKLVGLRATFRQKRLNGNLREAPFAMNFFGGSGVGKSSLSALSMVTILMSNGFEASDEYMLALNEVDKYMSNFKSHTTGVHLDDVNNTKAQFAERAPTSRVIELINNVPQYAVVAEAELKGKITVQPKVVCATTNDKNLGATQYSNEPVSIARRFNLTITVSVRPEFSLDSALGNVGQMLDAEKVAAFYYNPDTDEVEIPTIPDLWILRVERVLPVLTSIIGGKAVIGYEVCTHNGKELSHCSVIEFLSYATELSRVHFRNQKALVERSKNLSKQLMLCPKCKNITQCCSCVCDPHSGYLLGMVAGQIARKAVKDVQNSFMDNLREETTFYEKWASRKLLYMSRSLDECWFMRWTNWIPHKWLVKPWGRQLVLMASRKELVSDIKRRSTLGLLAASTSLLVGKIEKQMVLGCCGAGLAMGYTIMNMRVAREQLYVEILQRNDCVPEVIKGVREKAMTYILGALGSFAVLYTLGRMYQGFVASGIDPHGNLAPCCAEDIEKKDSETNPWQGQTLPVPLPSLHKQKTITPEDLRNMAFKNLCSMSVIDQDMKRSCNAFFLCSNVALIPFHMWYPEHRLGAPPMENMRVEFVHSQSPRAPTGHKFVSMLGLSHAAHIPGTDLCLVWVPNGGEWRDLREYLPLGGYNPGPAMSVYRMPDGGRYDDVAVVNAPGLVGHTGAEFPGSYVQYTKSTFVGMCMAPMISQSRTIAIIGFHLGGKAPTTMGCIGTVTQSQVHEAFVRLTSLPEVIATHSMGEMDEEEYGIPVLTTTDIHKNCPLNYLDAHCNVVAFGSTSVRSTPVSHVVQTPISPLVSKICGAPCGHGKPNFFPRWRPWYESLLYSSHPSIGVPPHLLTKSVRDYLDAILPILKIPGTLKYARKLSRMETLCGIDGVRFLDAVPLGTSAGFPFAGPKRQFVEVLERTDEHQCPLELDSRFWSRVEDCEQRYLRGERCYPIFKACLKDEPTKLGKDKVRVFQAAPLHFGLLIRMYFLPIVRMLSLHPLKSECAVGINCQGPEWKQLVDHVTGFGRDRILAGDYGKYDLRMPAQLILAAFGVLISMAEQTGRYAPDDFLIMRGIATDVAYAMTAYDGTLLQFIGSNPSGQNLTVYVNSIVNSLLFRCAYFDMDDSGRAFNENVRLTTYGDDAMGSVHLRCPHFNHISVAKFLARYDMEFTMPDKTSQPTEYMDFSNVDFLKRRDVYHPVLNISFGALDESSIFKSLHCVMRSKELSMQEQCSLNLEGALREWFFHGEDIYESRRRQLEEVAREAQIAVRGLDLTYDERVAQWCVDYNWELPRKFGSL